MNEVATDRNRKSLNLSKEFFLVDKISFVFLVLAVIFIPINYSFYSLRFSDLFCILFLICRIPFFRLSLSMVVLPLQFCTILGLSSVIGIVSTGEIHLLKSSFIYKFALFFMLPLGVLSLDWSEKRNLIIEKALYIAFFVLVLWVYYFVAFKNTGYWRPSFPASNKPSSDAHLYAFFLAMGSLACLVFRRKFLSNGMLFKIFYYFMFALSIGSIILTGSRTGSILFAMGVLFATTLGIINIPRLFTFKRNIVIAGMVSTLSSILAYYYFKPVFLSRAIERTFRFDLFNDVSSINRLQKLYTAFEEIQGGSLIFGVGVFSTRSLWYDNSISIILAMGGLLGVLVFFLYILSITLNGSLLLAKKGRMSDYKVFLFFMIVYVTGNMITEFFLVTRAYLPFVILMYLVVSSQSAIYKAK